MPLKDAFMYSFIHLCSSFVLILLFYVHGKSYRIHGDVLVGTDGIWSKIRKQMVGDTPAHYSEYTVYTVGCSLLAKAFALSLSFYLCECVTSTLSVHDECMSNRADTHAHDS